MPIKSTKKEHDYRLLQGIVEHVTKKDFTFLGVAFTTKENKKKSVKLQIDVDFIGTNDQEHNQKKGHYTKTTIKVNPEVENFISQYAADIIHKIQKAFINTDIKQPFCQIKQLEFCISRHEATPGAIIHFGISPVQSSDTNISLELIDTTGQYYIPFLQGIYNFLQQLLQFYRSNTTPEKTSEGYL